MSVRFSLAALAGMLLVASCFLSCGKVYDGSQLSSKTSQRLQQLGLLHSKEKIYQFYSNSPTEAAGAGNFYTSKRIAHYWLDKDSRKTQLDFAYYKDITRIDTIYLDKGLMYVSYMVVTQKDGRQFRVYVGGKRPVVSIFFEHAIAHWKAEVCAKN